MLSSWLVFILAVQAASAPALPLNGIEVAGAKRYSSAEVARISGLEIGKPLTVADLDAAAQRMADTGLFANLNYRYVTSAKGMTVTFTIEEPAWTIPVVFDNFVWSTDAQVIAALKDHIPSFDGLAPSTSGISAFIAHALEKLLKARGIAGRVEFVPHTDLRTKAQQYVFKIVDPAPRICAITVDGATPAWQQELGEPLRPLVSTEYSRVFTQGMANGTLVHMYRTRGYWRAGFGDPVVVMDAPGCAGVTVSLPVREGAQYTWDRAIWSDNRAHAVADLDRLFGMKRGDVADISTIDPGLQRVKGGYGKIGHVLATATHATTLDDAARRVTLEIRLDEGQQFRFGSVEFVGLPEADAANLMRRWRLKPGEVFDASYASEFLREEIMPPLVKRLGKAKPPVQEGRLDRQQQLVHLRFVFK